MEYLLFSKPPLVLALYSFSAFTFWSNTSIHKDRNILKAFPPPLKLHLFLLGPAEKDCVRYLHKIPK